MWDLRIENNGKIPASGGLLLLHYSCCYSGQFPYASQTEGIFLKHASAVHTVAPAMKLGQSKLFHYKLVSSLSGSIHNY